MYQINEWKLNRLQEQEDIGKGNRGCIEQAAKRK